LLDSDSLLIGLLHCTQVLRCWMALRNCPILIRASYVAAVRRSSSHSCWRCYISLWPVRIVATEQQWTVWTKTGCRRTSDFATGADTWRTLWNMRVSLILVHPLHYGDMTSSTKPEMHNLHCCQWRTQPQPQVTYTETFVNFGCVVFEICVAFACWQTDRQSYRQYFAQCFAPSPGGGAKLVLNVFTTAHC